MAPLDGLAPSVVTKALSYRFPDSAAGLADVNLSLPPGSRTLLIGGTMNSNLL